MGAIRGSISVRRYRTSGELPRDQRARFMKGLRAHVHLPIDPDSDVERSVGWVSCHDGDDADLTAEKVFHGERMLFALRIDTLKPPAAEVRRELARREREKDRPLSKSEKKALKADVVRRLRKRTFVRSRVLDVVWTPDKGRLYFFGRSKAVNEALVQHFAQSFAMSIEPEGPAAWAAGLKGKRALEPAPELLSGFGGERRG